MEFEEGWLSPCAATMGLADRFVCAWSQGCGRGGLPGLRLTAGGFRCWFGEVAWPEDIQDFRLPPRFPRA